VISVGVFDSSLMEARLQDYIASHNSVMKNFAARRARHACVSMMDATLHCDREVITMDDDSTMVPIRGRFDDFYRAEYPGMVAVATALAGRFQDGEDLVQDTMVKALVRWPKVERLERPGGWAHRVLLNACRGWWRRQQTEARFLARLRREELTESGPSPDVVAFWSAVRRLPERHRLVMALHYAGDRSVADVASILDVPEGTVRSDLTRARAALAAILER
jgi:RNA polymerase sigma-70 factor, ECF subfamily